MSDRRRTVSSVIRPTGPLDEYKTVASIRMTGSWLEALGFCTGRQFDVKSEPGRIVLIAATPKEEKVKK